MGRARHSVNFFGVFALFLYFGGGVPAPARAAGDDAGRAAPLPATVAAPAAGAPTAPARPSRDRFLIVPFANSGGQRTLDFLQAALPALVAERLSRHPALRFGGPPALLERARLDETLAGAAAGGSRYVVAGRFEKLRDWRMQVTVDVYAAGTPERRLGQGVSVGAKDDVSRTAVAAALDAFAAAGVPSPADLRTTLTAPFARDPYAFVLYGRGVAAYTGLDQPFAPAGTDAKAQRRPTRRPPRAGERPANAERALQPLGKSLVIDPKVPESRRYVGLIHLDAGRPGHARAMWSYAVDVRPDYTAAVLGLALLDRTQGLPTARERYARVLELDADDLEARRAYGELLSEAGRLDDAQAQLERVVAAAPGDLRARRALALVLAARRAGGELAGELAEIVRLDPEDLDARLELGAAYVSIGKIDPALETYEEVLRRRPKNAAALKIAADLYRGKGEPARAAAYYEKLRRLAPDDPRPVFLLGASYYDAGRLDAAERMFTEGARFPGMLGDAYSNLGVIAYKRGHFKEAVWFLSRAAQRRPGKAGVRYNYALALQAVERYDDALRELLAAAASSPTDAEVRFLAGVVALRLGRLADAEAYFQETLRLDPAHDNARHNLALLASLRTPAAEGSFSLH